MINLITTNMETFYFTVATIFSIFNYINIYNICVYINTHKKLSYVYLVRYNVFTK